MKWVRIYAKNGVSKRNSSQSLNNIMIYIILYQKIGYCDINVNETAVEETAYEG